MLFGSREPNLVEAKNALRGRDQSPHVIPERHVILGTPLQGPWPTGTEVIFMGLGCFWGAERLFWKIPGVIVTAVGYQGGFTQYPTYEEVCTGQTGHTEVVLIAYDSSLVKTEELLRTFWEGHDPTQGFRQGNDRGTQYRSALYWTTPAQRDAIESTMKTYQEALRKADRGTITTEIRAAEQAGKFFYAEEYHQQYLHKVPHGYCGIGGTGVSCPIP
ncbi:MAG: peptide-methionine (S)-S-oxide reductase MsrA [Actinomycetota bacterium]